MDITLLPVKNDDVDKAEIMEMVENDIDFIERLLIVSGVVLTTIGERHKLMDVIEASNDPSIEGMDITLLNLLKWVLENKNELEHIINLVETE